MAKFFVKVSEHPASFPLAMAAIFAVSFALRFWGLSRFNTLVFDEIYFAKFGNHYLTQTPFFDAHPPLGKYMIALGIWIGQFLPFDRNPIDDLTGSLLTPWAYRWSNAFAGSFLPIIVGAIAYQLNRRRSFALLAASFTAADGFLLVESRYALIDLFLVFFGLLGQWTFLRAVLKPEEPDWRWLTLAGVFFGAAASVKWNGLGFWLGTIAVWIAAKIWQWRRSLPSMLTVPPLQKLANLKVFPVLFTLIVIPAIAYSLFWIPHIQLNPKYDFIEVHDQIFGYHRRLGNGSDIHPYCSNWLSWVVMWRPVLYYYEKAGGNLPVNPELPPLPENSPPVVFAVHAMGNPMLSWLSTLAIFILIFAIAYRCWQHWRSPQDSAIAYDWIGIYLGGNYLANWLPWAIVTRCTFLYHYMSASVFSFMAIAWFVDLWLHSDRPYLRVLAIVAIGAIAIAFCFWLPVYLGLPISLKQWQMRMWLPSWI